MTVAPGAMADDRRVLGELVNRLRIFLVAWLLGLAGLAVYLAEVVSPLPLDAMKSFLGSSLTVTAGLLVGVFFVAAYSADHLPEPPAGVPLAVYRRRWAFSFLWELLALTLGLFVTVAGVFSAIDAATTLLVLLLCWTIGAVSLGSGLFRIVAEGQHGSR